MPNMAWMHAYPQVLSSYWVANYGTIRSLQITRLAQELHAYF
jgi:ribosomal protein L15E